MLVQLLDLTDSSHASSGGGKNCSEVCISALYDDVKLLIIMISSIAIEDIRKMPGAIVIFFYCEFQDSTKRNPTILLSTLLDQLLDQLELSPTAEGLLQRLSSRRSLHELDLESLILTFAAEFFDRVFVFIDGLDECDPEELEELVQNVTTIATKLRVFVASRELPEIRQLDGHLQLTIYPDDIAADLRQFVEADVKRLKVGDPALITEIVETLVQGAGGT